MEQIRDKQGQILHILFRKEDFTDNRIDVIDSIHILQCAALSLEHGHKFRAHRHIPRSGPKETIAQEAWVVVSGKIQVYYYNKGSEFLGARILYPGDVTITLYGGHTYETLEDSLVYEFKTGPYEGQRADKVWID